MIWLGVIIRLLVIKTLLHDLYTRLSFVQVAVAVCAESTEQKGTSLKGRRISCLPFASLHSSLAVNTPEAAMVSLQITSL